MTVQSDHQVDGMGLITGGHAVGPGFAIVWDVASDLDIARAVRDRLAFAESHMESGGLVTPSPDRRQALDHLADAIACLERYHNPA